MGRVPAVFALILALVLSGVPFLAWIGLGIHRHADPIALTLAATLLVYVPPLLALMGTAQISRRHRHGRLWWLATTLSSWSVATFLVMPVYFPEERRDAVATGLGLLGFTSDQLPRRLAANLPDEPTVATPQVAEAETLVVAAPPPPQPIGDDQIALPYEGEGRRMSVPVIFGSTGSREVEIDMLLDTGATYTTLSRSVLERLGVQPSKKDPIIRLHTANGEREASLVLVDHVWLGDLKIDGVAIAVCDDCGTGDTAGLLGLNVVGGFNVAIDADRREVVFTRRASFDRKLDVKPFIDLGATFTRFPGGRVEVVVKLHNSSPRKLRQASTGITCRDERWTVATNAVAPGQQSTSHRKLPDHDPCDEYEITLLSADW
jgi:clan AA aspartic protease (TIGR02281 family)